MKPDIEILWVKRMIAKLRRELRGDEVLLTFSLPFSINLIGLELKRAGKVNKWIAYLSDPWVDNPYYHFSKSERGRNEALERAVFKQADAILMPSPDMITFFSEKYPRSSRKLKLLPHSADPELFSSSHLPPRDKIVIRYIGAVYPQREPSAFLEALSYLPRDLRDRISLEVIGPISIKSRLKLSSQLKRLGLRETVSLKPPVSYKESIKLMQESNILLLIDAPTESFKYFFPAKLVDYLYSRRFIIGITPTESTSDKLLRQLYFPSLRHYQVRELSELLKELIEGTIPEVKVNERLLQEFNAARNARKLLTWLQELAM